MNDIESLLKLVPEKFEWRNTTSKKFKYDVYNFFNKDEFKNLSCLEIGCAKGHTTLILSKLFKNVYGINAYEAVTIDILNSLKLRSNNKKYLIFDDTGIEPPVLKAVNDMCHNNVLKIITTIGHKPGDFFHRELYSEEGLICVEL